jgi:hypothetical protein
MALSEEPAADVSVRQFVADSGAVTRGLRQGRAYTLTLNGEPTRATGFREPGFSEERRLEPQITIGLLTG